MKLKCFVIYRMDTYVVRGTSGGGTTGGGLKSDVTYGAMKQKQLMIGECCLHKNIEG